MAKNAIPSYADLNTAIKAVADIPSKVDDEGFVIADGVSLTKNVYDPKNGNYELHVRDVKNNKWKSFDNYDNANCIEDAAKCFVDFYKARSTSESHKCSMAKKIESLAKKSESTDNKDLSYNGFMTQWQTDIVDGLSSYMDMLGFNLDYNEEKNDPVHGTAARFDVTLDDGTDMGSIGPGYFHTYTDTSFTHSKPFSSRQFSNPADVVDKFVDLIKAYNSKPAESKKSESHKCSMAKKIESLRKRSEGIDDVVNANDAATKSASAGKIGRYAKAQDILNYNKNNDQDWKAHKFLDQYIVSKYGVEWSDSVSDQHKFWFKDKNKAQEFVDILVKYADLPAADVTMGRSVGNCGRTNPRVGWYIFKAFKHCPEWQADFNEYIKDDIRKPVADIKRDVDRERSISPEYKKFVSDIKDFQDELADVIRNAVKLRTEVTYYNPHNVNAGEEFRVAVDGGFNDSASKSITKVLNNLAAKYNPVPGGQRVDKDAAAEVLAALEASLS